METTKTQRLNESTYHRGHVEAQGRIKRESLAGDKAWPLRFSFESLRVLRGFFFLFMALCLGGSASFAQGKSTLGAKPPRGAVVLFEGKSAEKWAQRSDGKPCNWTIKDGELIVTAGQSDILTKEKFRDFVLHVEYNLPDMPDARDQGKANSGVYMHGLYEIQVLDSFNNGTYANGMCGAIYGQKAPDINACKPAGQWQTYDITFRAPRVDAAGKVIENPRISVLHNGIKIHENVEITVGPTTSSLGGPMTATGPIMLQNHGAAVRYRNVWIKASR